MAEDIMIHEKKENRRPDYFFMLWISPEYVKKRNGQVANSESVTDQAAHWAKTFCGTCMY
jgi:hypothetical protein